MSRKKEIERKKKLLADLMSGKKPEMKKEKKKAEDKEVKKKIKKKK